MSLYRRPVFSINYNEEVHHQRYKNKIVYSETTTVLLSKCLEGSVKEITNTNFKSKCPLARHLHKNQYHFRKSVRN